MYVAAHHRMPSVDRSHALVEANPLGAWAVPGVNGIVANHLPFLLDRSQGELGTLRGHVSRANPVWRELHASGQSIVMFQGPQAYITPNWYPGKHEHGRVVPTWDYAVVHAHGIARAIHDDAWIHDLLTRLTNANETSQTTPWRLADAPPDFIEKLLRAVVGIEIPIDTLVGKLKASQDEDLEDRRGTVNGLMRSSSENAFAMALLVQQAIDQSEDR